jgi:predicted phosphodiesterase
MRRIMRLLVYSDLHLEFTPFEVPAALHYDVAILAGDISTPGGDAVRWAQRRDTFGGRPVILVPGNHEYYGTRRPLERQRMRQLAGGSNVHLLDGDAVEIDGVRFLGATLWTDFDLDTAPDGSSTRAVAMRDARATMPDFTGMILEGRTAASTRRFSPGQSRTLHHRARRWLEATRATPFDGPTVVVSHHGPSRHSLDPRFAGSALDPCFASDLPDTAFDGVDLWIHGHLHCSHDYRVGATRVLCNPRGVVNRRGQPENPRFDAACLIDVSAPRSDRRMHRGPTCPTLARVGPATRPRG